MPAEADRRRRLADLDHRHVWHPFTPMRLWRQDEPLIIERAEGCELIDVDGNRYIDGVSSLWCNVHGHRVDRIDAAIRDQLEKVAHTTLLGLASPPSIELAAMLCRIAPGDLTKVFYTDAGATALEVAFKMAVGYWHHRGRPQKNRFVAFGGSYHGDTTGSMSVGYSEVFHAPFRPMLFETILCPIPDACRPPSAVPAPVDAGQWPSLDRRLNDALRENSLAALEGVLQRRGDQIAAIVVEPVVQGAAGMICQPPGFLGGVADLARRHDVLLIADEVATGFGRTGKLFACDHEAVAPDILCVAKGLSGGYLPLAATLATDAIEQAFAGQGADHLALYHGHTYTGNPLACAAAVASLELFESSRLLEHIETNASIMAGRLEALRSCPHVLDVRQRGIMVGIELCLDRRSRQPLDPAHRTGAALCRLMRRRGLIVRPLGDVLVLMPIAAMPHDLLQRMLDVVVETVSAWQPARSTPAHPARQDLWQEPGPGGRPPDPTSNSVNQDK
jgi:adenosylmethionine-8-amino-7-oxononanoate aminotransferase